MFNHKNNKTGVLALYIFLI